MTKKQMTEKEIDELVNELQNSPMDLNEYVNNALEDADEKEVEELVEELQNSFLDLREFIINSL